MAAKVRRESSILVPLEQTTCPCHSLCDPVRECGGCRKANWNTFTSIHSSPRMSLHLKYHQWLRCSRRRSCSIVGCRVMIKPSIVFPDSRGSHPLPSYFATLCLVFADFLDVLDRRSIILRIHFHHPSVEMCHCIDCPEVSHDWMLHILLGFWSSGHAAWNSWPSRLFPNYAFDRRVVQH